MTVKKSGRNRHTADGQVRKVSRNRRTNNRRVGETANALGELVKSISRLVNNEKK